MQSRDGVRCPIEHFASFPELLWIARINLLKEIFLSFSKHRGDLVPLALVFREIE